MGGEIKPWMESLLLRRGRGLLFLWVWNEGSGKRGWRGALPSSARRARSPCNAQLTAQAPSFPLWAGNNLELLTFVPTSHQDMRALFSEQENPLYRRQRNWEAGDTRGVPASALSKNRFDGHLALLLLNREESAP